MTSYSYDERCSERTEYECKHINWNSDTSGHYDEVHVWCDDCGETIAMMTKANFRAWANSQNIEYNLEANDAKLSPQGVCGG